MSSPQSNPLLIPPTASIANPLNKPVDLIAKNPEYITDEHAQRLLAAIPERFVAKHAPVTATATDGTISETLSSLANQLKNMTKLSERLMRTANQSDDPDIQRRAMTSAKELFQIMAKFDEQIDRQERMKNIEMAVREAFEEVKDEHLKAVFLAKLREKLVISAQNK